MKKITKSAFAVIAAAAMTLSAACSGGVAPETEEPPTVSLETQAIELDGVGNARQLGGYVCADGRKIKDGALLRSAALSTLTDEGAKTLSEKYHLKYVFDFRTDSEREAQPDKEVAGAEDVWLPVFTSALYDDETIAAMKEAMQTRDPEQTYITLAKHKGLSTIYSKMLLTDEGKKAYSEFFEKLLTVGDGEAVLWHCTQGKDRAGMAAVLLLYALGADEDTIKQDYLLTNDSYKDLIAESEARAAELELTEDETKEYVGTSAAVYEDFLNVAIDSVKTEYGSVQGYLTDGLGLSDDDINALRDKFLE